MTSPLTSLPTPLQTALADKGYDTLTAVQEAVLDPALAGRDMLVSAQTGSGKTVAFGLAIAGQLLGDDTMLPPPDTPRVVVIAPTRELALQVRREFEWLYGTAGASIASCVGGMDIRTERRALERGAHIVVGTPGRLRDHIERETIDLSAVQAVVLDEADEMLDLGFREDLEFILDVLPPERRTLLFSATVSPGIERLAQTYQRDAERLATAAAREAHGDITYRALTVNPEDAENAIVNVLRYYEAKNALVFCKTRAAVNHLTARFLNRGFPVVPLSGELAQDERARALQAMRDGRARVCVATDVAARGIDLPGLELVIHADLPTNKETLLHRSGRTGRAGNKGVSVLIVPLSAKRKTERLLGFAAVQAEWAAAPTAAEVSARDTERLLTDEALGAPEKPEETPVIDLLAERFSARELAAAVARYYFAARSAPEDVTVVTPEGPKPRPRADFERSFWMRVNAGHNQRAEPRWLLPMLCRAGNLTKADIGAIRIYDDATLVQLHDDCRERFLSALGEGMTLEQGLAVTPAEAPAEDDRPAPRPRRDDGPRPPRGDGPRKPYGDRPDRKPRFERPEGEEGERPARPPRKPYTERPETGPRKSYGERGDSPRKSYGDRPDRAPRKPYGDRGDAPRKPYGDRTDSGPRKPYGERTEGGPRKSYGDRPDSGPRRPYGAPPERGPRKDYGERPERPAPAKFARPAAAEGGERPARAPRTEASDAPRKPRTPKPRADAPAGDKPARPRIDPAAARDPSARLGAPKRTPGKFSGKPGGKPAPKGGFKPGPRAGGDQRPTRPKR